MKNLTRIFLSSLSLILVMAYSARSQDVFKTAPVGIGTTHPTQALDIEGGNVKFSGALMPNGVAGSTNNIFVSGGASFPSWDGNGTIGQVLISSGGVPTWGSANSALTTSNIVNGGANSVVVVTNGIGQVVGNSNVTLDVRGTLNGILYGQGAGNSALFTAAGSSGQALTANGSGVPVYAGYGYWNLTGNAGTNAAVNFIGTTNDEPLVFYTDGTSGYAYAGEIDPQYIGGNLKGNTLMGESSSSNVDYGAGNYDAGNYNVGIGCSVLGQNTTGVGNVGVSGFAALSANTTGSYNIAFGRNLRFNWEGNGNIALGYYALLSASGTSSYNTAIGYGAAYSYAGNGTNYGNGTNGIGSFNTAVGYEALYINNSTNNAVSNTALGSYSLFATTGKQNTAVGDSTLYTNTSGNYNSALGYQANINAGTYSNATVIGYNAKAPSSNSITLGSTTTNNLYLPGYNSVGSLLYTSANTGLVSPVTPGTSGQYLQSNSSGVPTWANVTPTSGSVTTVTGTAPIEVTGSYLVGIQGTNANKGGVLYSAGSGISAQFTSTGTTGQVLTSTGTGAAIWAAPVSTAWNVSGNAGTNPSVNFIGTLNDEPLVFKTYTNYGIPYYSGQIDPGNLNGNTYMGQGVNSSTSQIGNGADGGTFNVGIGCAALSNVTTGSYNVVLSNYLSMQDNTTGSYNVAIDYQVLQTNVSGNGNIGTGFQALHAQATNVSYNIGIGTASAFGSAAVGWYNTALGAMSLATSGGAGFAYGASNTALGSFSANAVTGKQNTAIGDSTLYTASFSGKDNATLGYKANVSLASATNATAIGYNATATKSNTVILGNGSAFVGINTSTPQQLLEIGGSANTIRNDGLAGGGSYNTKVASNGNIVYVNSATGDLYSLPNGTNGQVLALNTNGVPTWSALTSANLSTYNIVPGSGSSVVVTNGSNQVVGSGNVTVDVQGTAGGIFYGNVLGTPASFSPAGSSGLLLVSGGTGVPTWVNTATAYDVWAFTGGNVITAPYGTDFLGTINDVPLEFYGLSQATGEAGRIDPVNQNIFFSGDVNGQWAGGGGGSPIAGSMDNVAMGSGAMGGAVSGTSNNVFIAYANGYEYDAVSNGNGSTAIGNGAFRYVTTGIPNSGFGAHTIDGNGGTGPGGNNNLAMGYYAEYGRENGVSNVAIGAQSLYDNLTTNYNTAVGFQAVYTASGTGNAGIGYESAHATSTGSYNTAIGYESLLANTTGSYNTALGYSANVASAALSNATAIGYSASAPVSNSITLGNSSVAYNAGTGAGLYLPGYNNVGSFFYTAANSGLVASTAPGASGYLLQSNGSGTAPTWANITPSSGSVTTVTGTAPITVTGNWNIGIRGTSANSGGLLYSLGSGASAQFISSGTSGEVLESTGTGAPTWVSPSSLGFSVWNFTGGNNISATYGANFVGTLSGSTYPQIEFRGTSQETGIFGLIDNVYHNIYFGGDVNGAQTGTINSTLPTGPTNNVALGNASLGDAAGASYGTTTASNNVTIGYATGYAILATNPATPNAGGYGNTAVGSQSFRWVESGPNEDFGRYAFTQGQSSANTGAKNNLAFGEYSENALATTTALRNVGIGTYTLDHVTVNDNTGVGYYALYTTNSGANNTAIGYYAQEAATGTGNTGIGYETLLSATGNYNTALGYNATITTASSSNATVIGYNASAPASASKSITLGNTASASLYVPGYNSTYSIYYTAAPNGLVASLAPGTSGYYLKSNGPGVAPSWASITTVSGTVSNVIGVAPITIAPSTYWQVGIQGANSNAGGVLYSAGSGTSALFSSAGSTGEVLTSTGTGIPTWQPLPVTGWTLTGNTGTTPSINHVGTDDDKQFVFMSSYSYYYGNNDNPEAGSIDPQFVGATTYGNVYLGVANADNGNGPAGNNDQGTYNVSFGRGTMGNITSGIGNVAMGTQTFTKNNGNYNVVLGSGLFFYGSSNGVTGIGSGNFNTQSGNNDTYIGYLANSGSNTGAANTTLGANNFISGGAGQSNTAIGVSALNSNSSSNRNTAIGDSALYSTTGESNTALGYQAHQATAANFNTTAIGYNAASPLSNSVTLGNTSAHALYLPGYNTAGSFLYTSNANGLVSSLPSEVTSGQMLQSNGASVAPSWNFVTPGTGTVTNVTATAPATVTGSWVIGLQGNSSNTDKGGVLYSTGSGSAAGFTPTPSTAGLVLLSSTSGAPPVWGSAASSAWLISGNAGTTSANFFGTTDAHRINIETYDAGTTEPAGSIDPPVSAGGNANVYLGPASTNFSTGTGAGNNDAGTYNVGIGRGVFSGASPTAMGNTAVGDLAMNAETQSGKYNVAFGFGAGFSAGQGTGNTIAGGRAGKDIGTGSYNTVFGAWSQSGTNPNGTTAATGWYNTSAGYFALYGTSLTKSGSSTAIGTYSSYNTIGSRNTAIGDSALYSVTTGANNTALGTLANVSLGTASNATAIGYSATTATSNTLILGNGTAHVGINTSTPQQLLELGGTTTTARVDALRNSGSYNKSLTGTGNIVYANSATGDLYALPNGTSGQILTLNTYGVPSWSTASNSLLIRNSIVPAVGSSVVVNNGTNQVVGNSNVTVDVQGTTGGVYYGTGVNSPAAFTPAGSSGLVLQSNGTGVPTWAAANFNAWLLTGNTGTTPGTNFIGTTDANRISFQVDGTTAGTLDLPVSASGNGNAYFGYYTSYYNAGVATSGSSIGDIGTNNTAIGMYAYNQPTNAGGGANYNVAMGYNDLDGGVGTWTPGSPGNYNIGAGPNNLYIVGGSGNVVLSPNSGQHIESGSYNTGFGYQNFGQQYLYSDVGSFNTAAGYYALSSNIPGEYNDGPNYYISSNTGIGNAALENANYGGKNTALGSATLTNLSSSEYNTAVGDSAFYATAITGVNNTAFGALTTISNPAFNNATAIGYQANAIAGNSITLGNTAAKSLYVPGYNTANSFLFTNNSNGLVASTGAGISGNYLQSNGTAAAPTWSNVSISSGTVTNVIGASPITVAGSWVVGIQGNSSNTDKGGVLYSAGSGVSAQFTPTPSAASMVLESSASGAAPTWQLPSSVSTSWAVLGNSGITPGTDFIGTTDANRLDFKAGNAFAGTIDLPTTAGGNGNAYLGYEINYYADVATTGGDFGTNNTALGYFTYPNINTTPGSSTYNIAIGTNDLNGGGAGTGSYNIGTGPNNLYYVLTGSGNVNLSANSGGRLTNGNYNTGFGYENFGVGNDYSYVGSNNVAVGYGVLYVPNAGYVSSNTGVGYNALDVATAGKNTAIGSGALTALSSGNYNTAVGDSAFYGTLTTGAENTAIGAQASISTATLTNATAIGFQAKVIASASNSITLGNTAATSLYVPGYNTTGSLLFTANPNGLVASTGAGTSGYLLESNGTGAAPAWANVAIGSGTVTNVSGAAPIVVTGSWNVGIDGSSSYADNGGVLYSTGSSSAAAFVATPSAAGLVLASGTSGSAPSWAVAPVASAWFLTGNSNATASSFVGTTTAVRLPLRVDNVTSGTIDLPTSLGGNGNSYFGFETGLDNNGTATSGATIGDPGLNNTAIGFLAYHDPDYTGPGTASYNTAIGMGNMNGTGLAGSTGSYNVGSGFNSLYPLTTGSGNVFLANRSGQHIETGNYNTGFGHFVFGNTTNDNAVGSYNVAAGWESMYTNTTTTANSNSNTAIGALSLEAITNGKNTAVGDSALNTTTTAEYNTAVGYGAFTANAMVANDNRNTALGYLANTSTVTISNATAIGARAYASTSNTIVLGDISGVNTAAASPAVATNVGAGTNAPATDAALAIQTGHLETQGQLTSASSATAGTVSPGSSAGTGATASITSATDVGGQISITTGSSGNLAGTQAIVDFANPYIYSPIVVLTPANSNAAAAMTANQVYPTTSTSLLNINFGVAASPSTTYKFNYYAIETPGTTPANPILSDICYVPITLTNSQSTATSANFTQMITVNSSLFSAEEYSGLQNVEFTVGGPLGTGTPIYAWLESGNSSSSTSTVWWVNLGSNQISNGSPLTIYMNFNTSAVMASTSSYTGEAPQLSTSWGQYDNGTSVFTNFYDNFAGTSLASKWSVAASVGYNVNNTLEITSCPGHWYGIYTNTFTSCLNTIAEADCEASTVAGDGLDICTPGGYPDGVEYELGGASGSCLFGVGGTLTTSSAANENSGGSCSANTYYVMSAVITNSPAPQFWLNYTNQVTGTGSPAPTTVNGGVGLGVSSADGYFKWFRDRQYPPGGVMPTYPAITAGAKICE